MGNIPYSLGAMIRVFPGLDERAKNGAPGKAMAFVLRAEQKPVNCWIYGQP